ncbi:DNA replication/repair protein RecF [Kangiella aquimarina]|uniref:DNA replication and repair protein RecF n=1 Tax=Kangiella aquimarina TaxID=261965 RepID=A0ABZ0X5J8_9GAMM|nr:DNA replication/repair protein RecF [Kangiella aquimarina]WQG85629.1 DNA replication/repair protein RecF [Kangiella aquimarina]
MHIQSLSIENFRNLQPTRLHFSPQLNIIYGNNAAGKTSILESLYILGHGRSFRTSRHNKLVNHDHDSFTLFAELTAHGSGHKLGIQRFRNNDVHMRLNQEPLSKLSDLVSLAPVQVLAPEHYELLTKGSSGRRKMLDWGVFHVEHSFLKRWQDCQRLILQRNKLLKTSKSYRELAVWDSQLVPLSIKVNQYREDYCQLLQPFFNSIIKSFLPDVDVSLHFYQGWQGHDLEQLLIEQYPKDAKHGYTHSTIQKADLKIMSGKRLAADYLSRGQQKLVTTALKLAQLSLAQERGQQYPVFLLDDIGAELDQEHQQMLLDFLAQQPSSQQIFITCVHLDPLKSLINRYNNVRLFHVEHGAVTVIDTASEKNVQ